MSFCESLRSTETTKTEIASTVSRSRRIVLIFASPSDSFCYRGMAHGRPRRFTDFEWVASRAQCHQRVALDKARVMPTSAEFSPNFWASPGGSGSRTGEGLVHRLMQLYSPRLPDATHRAAASALSSGRVLNAIAAPGAALRTALMTTSNSARLRGGRRTPPPMTTQS